MDDKTRWNDKHRNVPMPNNPSKLLIRHLHDGIGKRALDIACGIGRHTHLIADAGYEVDAVDISDYALGKLNESPLIHPIEADLSRYEIAQDRYDLIVNINYLERKLFPSILKGLKKDGLLIFETFITAHEPDYHNPSNPDYLLRSNELIEYFSSLEILFYEERDDINMYGEKVKIAAFVGKR